MEVSTQIAEDSQDSIIALQNRINQLEATIVESYAMFCPLYDELDFMQMTPQSFGEPYSTHSIRLPINKHNVTFITTPPLLVIGAPQSKGSGPLQWGQILEIELPSNTNFVGFRYGGGSGNVEWLSTDNSVHTLPTLPAPTADEQSKQFYLAKRAGIRHLKITSSEMFLYTLAIGTSSR
jgi:hypothetical protein